MTSNKKAARAYRRRRAERVKRERAARVIVYAAAACARVDGAATSEPVCAACCTRDGLGAAYVSVVIGAACVSCHGARAVRRQGQTYGAWQPVTGLDILAGITTTGGK